MSETNDFKVKAYQQKQLRGLYNVGVKTWQKWMQLVPELGEYKGKAYTPAQVEKIVTHIGKP